MESVPHFALNLPEMHVLRRKSELHALWYLSCCLYVPVATIEGIDLVTEGILTLSRVLQLMREYASDNISEEFFFELDKPNGASQIAKVLIENCTHLDLFVGQTINEAHQNLRHAEAVR